MNENKRQDLLARMRGVQKDVDRSRATRSQQSVSRSQPGFAELPEYKQVVMQKLVSEQLNMPNPFYRAHESASGATADIDGRAYDNFASYDYLGLNSDPRIRDAAMTAIDQFGISASASRVVAGERTIHAELEKAFAKNYQTEDAICFVSGYLTNVTTIGSLMGPKDLVIHDEFIHNSALTGIKLSGANRRFFKHNDMADLDRILASLAPLHERILVISEGIFSMDGDVADLPGLLALKKQYNFWLMMDEAHSLGVLGQRGHGIFEHFNLDPADVDIWMGTLSKTTCSCGGYVAGSEALITLLKAQAGGFVYSVGLAPALAASAIASLSVLDEEPDRVEALRRNSQLFLEQAKLRGLDTGLSEGFSVVPVIVADSVRAVQLSNELFEAGINALPIIYPAVPEGLARLRFFITSAHTPEQITRSVDKTAEILDRLKAENFGMGSMDVQKVMLQLAQR
ncbi:aminotransferase class I/II-fold pyridoxal phosphate-dependent enzyme [Agrobacterium vitis]|uniref:Aminotransferase class I/II-fold pyridoxal phosphate-dependent enzyme n=1 Tax=Agrobacterium vitis TaxID=373 RepID=A0AAE5AW49_AGRVI|nr:aminotransferase class I/II-fold pyridoxal phosphate-dependent enzyme [Agrobacterium vitis]MCF1498271.1 aminotransferase class I/II-fold pyridoxal phosphate-dependent enzyme [Allorhizobium sp. Av2]MCM2440398.1 aminotransferase class I/II-fold pyridoxal phosphate-dependent enzyme [Agrobacterium vitis]MUZ58194.1 aminotransferase class I/II-fold pyridoxal phosphate-dependent enzyme [Agrobacterium vitis]MVA66156.1 aminotransferase class I/II-fold pyridoxal phosphate-dependent enzyme [Agrobacteri